MSAQAGLGDAALVQIPTVDGLLVGDILILATVFATVSVSVSVSVSATTFGRDALIRVTDDGDGFAPEAAAKGFRRFASNRQATPESTRHHGLGLAIVDEIARRHNGTVRIDTTSSGGASVIARFPPQSSS